MDAPPMLPARGPSSVAPRRPLKVGLIVPANEGELAGETPRWRDYLALARVTEELGFDSLWVPDHLLWRADDGTTSGTWEGWSLLTALAAVTARVEIGSFVSCTSFRAPALLAKMADTMDEISGGRLILGLGAGWNEPEYRAFGFPFDHRVGRFEEAVTIIHGLLRTGHIDFQGTYYAARDCELRPRGPRPGGPPIMIGSTGERMLRLMARYAAVWNAFFSKKGSGNRIERIPALQAAVDAACKAEGRDPATVERTAAVFVNTIPGAPLVLDGFAPPLRGTADELAAELRAYAAAGITHAQLWIEPTTPAGIAAFGPVLERLDGG